MRHVPSVMCSDESGVNAPRARRSTRGSLAASAACTSAAVRRTAGSCTGTQKKAFGRAALSAFREEAPVAQVVSQVALDGPKQAP